MFELRRATLHDISALQELIPLSARALSGEVYTNEQIEGAIRDIYGPDSRLIEDGTYYVVTEGTAIAGCGGWSKRRTLYGGDQAKRGEDALLDPGLEPARIRAFFVHPDWSRRGVARAILGACTEAARAAGFKTFELVATRPGEPLYAAAGFEVVERFEISLTCGATLPVARMRRGIDPV